MQDGTMKNTMIHFAWMLIGAVLVSACSNGSPASPSADVLPTAGVSASTGHGTDDPTAKVDWRSMQAFWERSIKLPGIDTGPANSSKRMLVYFDPNCPVCARQWKVLQPYLDQVRIHWIPVAYIDTTSARKAAAILAAKDPGQALSNNERDYDFKTQQGGLTPSGTAPDWALRKVKANTREMMRAGGLAATPTLVFELYPGKRYFRMEGLVDAASMKVAVAELGHTMDPWKHPKSVSDGNDGR